jgi:hypothetical protein
MQSPDEDPVSRPVFRVSFSGSRLEPSVISRRLDRVDLRWEGSQGNADDPNEHHRVLVGASTENEAIELARDALIPYGDFGNFQAAPVTDAGGGAKRTPIRRWEDIDWDDVTSKAAITELERALIGTFLNAAEPTWIILHHLDVPDDLELVEGALRDLEERGLVLSTWEPAGGPEDFGVLETWHGRPERMCHWWALADEGWDLLGLIKSPRYG